MKETESAILISRNDFLTNRGWQQKQCPLCLEKYYTKRDLPNCGSYDCVGNYSFLDIPSPKYYLELSLCAERFREFFRKRKYAQETPIALVRKNERTLFASTAGQIYDNLIYDQVTQVDPKRYAILQPVIRLQGIDLVGMLDGISTSFVHTATECWNVEVEEHWNIFDQWLDFLSSLGLHVGGLCLKIERADNNWSGRNVTSYMLTMNYGGLEIGVANFFFNIPQTDNFIASLSDIGVGLERLVWAVNKSPSYFDCIGPLSNVIMLNRVVLDAVRTATLMTSSGVIPNHRNQSSKLRTMIGLVTKEAQCLNLYELVNYYYRQWASLINPLISYEYTYSVIWREINRGLNLEINHTLGINEPLEQDHEDFLRGIVKKKIITAVRLRAITRRKI